MSSYHWVWYWIGFLWCPRLTIMIMLSIYFKQYIPIPLMLCGWIVAILSLFGGSSKNGSNYGN